jgi:RimJ/RimL family protein N-acetyltransferase
MFESPRKHIMENEWVRLVPIQQDHAKDLFENTVEDTEEIFTYMFSGPFYRIEELDAWVRKETDSTERITFSVFSKRLNKYVGVCSITNTDEKHGTSEVGNIWYGKAVQHTEINSSTILLLLEYLFDDLKYRRVVWKCDPLNEKSQKAALALGFSYEGTFRKHFIMKNRNRGTAWFSIIDDEWEMVKSRLKARIARKRAE